MNRLNRLLVISACAALLSACGGNDDAANETTLKAMGSEEETKKPYNPLAKEQQLIRDAQSIQGILDKDAEEKKKALAEIN